MRILRGIAALLALAVLLVGIPFCLAAFGGNPLPTGLSWEAAGQALLRPASDRVLIGIVAIAGWLVWAAFAASVVAEIANALPGRRVQLRLPGLGLGQKFAAVLIIAVVAMIATPHGAPTAIAEPRSPAPTPTTTVSAPQTPVTPPATLAAPAHDTSAASTAETKKTTQAPGEAAAHSRGGARGLAVEPRRPVSRRRLPLEGDRRREPRHQPRPHRRRATADHPAGPRPRRRQARPARSGSPPTTATPSASSAATRWQRSPTTCTAARSTGPTCTRRTRTRSPIPT